tara:strand:+ start:1275 stop:1898 length:624 start_codon:yes stop_codon:yes gene_type:complete
MCDPITGGMMALAVIQAQQQQAAEDAAVDQMNAAAEQAEEAEIAAYNRDMGAFFDEEVNLQEEGFQSAEDAADEKLQLLIEAKQKKASLEVMNLETIGGGQTADAIMAQHERAMIGATRDLEDNYQRGVKSRRKELQGMQRDKTNRYWSSVSTINSLPRSGKASAQSKQAGLVMAGVGGYTTGKSITRQTPSRSYKNYKPTRNPHTA